jgi:UDP-N-acetylmuramoyl-L-alanyl-D-glutamate--2,6-diaminopimelate ligase
MILGGVIVNKIVCDSRLADNDTAFVCLTGAVTDGHFYALSAYKAGCRLFICEYEIELPSDAICLLVPDTRIALAVLSAEIYGHPANRLKIIGITGTKGKTTVAYLLYEVLNKAGYKTALIGTNGIFIEERHTPTVNSTPESCELHRVFAEAVDCGTEIVVMEVSSQAYKMNRVFGIRFDIGVFTNLSPDHIGGAEHADYEDYRACKAKLFSNSVHSVINADDPECMHMAHSAAGTTSFYSIGHLSESFKIEYSDRSSVYSAGDIQCENNSGIPGVSFIYGERKYQLKIPGKFNASNAMAVIAVCEKIGIECNIVLKVLSETTIKGRFEPVEALGDRIFIIDYAHNGVSLTGALETLREFKPKRLVCLFGSVGGRTQLRRTEMGEIAARLADFLIITSDNPDNENPSDIIADIRRSVGDCPHICITDRYEAVEYAVLNSRPGDIILFSGKGHENYQITNGIRIPFCEREIIKSAAKKYMELINRI